MANEDLRKEQKKLLNIIDAICRENNLKYFLFAGTLLGAVRHKGFIPWDHDLDVALPREDYEKLLTIMSQKNDPYYFMASYHSSRKHTSTHAILYSKNIKITNRDFYSNEEVYFGGLDLLSIDVFPLDKGPDDVELQKKQSKKIHFLKKILYHKKSHIFRKQKMYKILKNLIRLLLSPISFRSVLKKIDLEMKRYNESETNYIIDGATSYTYSRTILNKRVYSSVVYLDFEGQKYPAPVGYEEYLSKYYGDYMKIPNQKEIDMKLKSFPILSSTNKD